MRRIVILFLLFLLPIEVLAGIAYEQHLAQDAQYEAGQSHGCPTVDSLPATPIVQDLDADSAFALDLGEAFDVPCKSFKKPTPSVASPPVHATYCDKSIVVDVPIPPAIYAVHSTFARLCPRSGDVDRTHRDPRRERSCGPVLHTL